MAELRIVRGGGDHTETCMAIARGLRTHFDDRAMERMPRDLREHRLLVAVDGEDRVVGFITLEAVDDRVMEITWMGVRPDMHRRGVGSALVDAAARELAGEGYRELEVRTLADTVEYRPYEDTRAFYRAQGFRLREVIDPYPGWSPGNPCARFVRSLDTP